MKNIIYLIISFVFIIWLFNFMKLNQLQERYDKAVIEYNHLIKQDSIYKNTVDSLEEVMDKLEVLNDELEQLNNGYDKE